MRLVVVGAGGMLGGYVLRAAGPDAVGYARSELDVADAAAVADAIGADDIVINCAAFTDVDGAEQREADAMRVNAHGARNVAEAGGAVVYVSSDYVFDGTKREPYVESDPRAPISAYGRSKAEGERATAAANRRSHIVRTSWLFGGGGRNFVDTMIDLGRARDEVRVVDDQVGQPTYAGHLAEALLEIAATERYGIHHRSSSGQCSWYEFARAILDSAGVDCKVEPCPSAEFPRPAPRPAYSVLGSERADDRPELPDWRSALAAYLAENEVRT